MKVTYIENLPLDGAGTLINPAYKWLQQERQEFCDGLQMYTRESAMMYRGGFTWHSVEVNKITRLEGNKGTAICTYHPNAPYPYNARISLHDQANDFGIGCKDFSEIMRYVL